jgi:hypothetical protein
MSEEHTPLSSGLKSKPSRACFDFHLTAQCYTGRDSNPGSCLVRDEGTVKGGRNSTDLPTVYNISSQHIGH